MADLVLKESLPAVPSWAADILQAWPGAWVTSPGCYQLVLMSEKKEAKPLWRGEGGEECGVGTQHTLTVPVKLRKRLIGFRKQTGALSNLLFGLQKERLSSVGLGLGGGLGALVSTLLGGAWLPHSFLPTDAET